jgi:DNA-binding PadR family transcriptional regulator
MQSKGLEIDPGTLYPLLRRLEKQGLLASEWDTT